MARGQRHDKQQASENGTKDRSTDNRTKIEYRYRLDEGGGGKEEGALVCLDS